MSGRTQLAEPGSCTERELEEFEALVRRGFRGSDEGLRDRIRGARLLALHRAESDVLTAIAALKSPAARYRDEVFEKAGTHVDPSSYGPELGWVFVAPACRGEGTASDLCERLLARAGPAGVFATTRPDNAPMIRILETLGFERTGRPYPRRDEELLLFLRSYRHA